MDSLLGSNYVFVMKDGDRVAAVRIKPVVEDDALKHFELCHKLSKDEEVVVPVSDGSVLNLKEGLLSMIHQCPWIFLPS